MSGASNARQQNFVSPQSFALRLPHAREAEASLSPIGHIQYGWWIAHARKFDRLERFAITAAAAVADLDGLAMFGGGDAYYKYHHILFHNVGFILVVAALAGIYFWRRPWAWLMLTAAAASHLVIDYFSVPWDMKPWVPFNGMVTNLDHHIAAPIVMYGFQSVMMALVLGVTVWIYLRHGRTPLELISPAFDRLIIGYAALPFRHHCAACSQRAHFRCDRCGKTFCADHAKPRHGCAVVCSTCAASAPAAES
jgi:LexA-binding, inner membrane-associated putative hydrolase